MWGDFSVLPHFLYLYYYLLFRKHTYMLYVYDICIWCPSSKNTFNSEKVQSAVFQHLLQFLLLFSSQITKRKRIFIQTKLFIMVVVIIITMFNCSLMHLLTKYYAKGVLSSSWLCLTSMCIWLSIGYCHRPIVIITIMVMFYIQPPWESGWSQVQSRDNPHHRLQGTHSETKAMIIKIMLMMIKLTPQIS